VFLKSRRQSRIAVEIWPWLVGFVALMMIPEIAIRRLGGGAVGALLARLSGRRPSESGTGGAS
jgi:hypothetical protein